MNLFKTCRERIIVNLENFVERNFQKPQITQNNSSLYGYYEVLNFIPQKISETSRQIITSLFQKAIRIKRTFLQLALNCFPEFFF